MAIQIVAGMRFGRLVTIQKAESKNGNSRWLCRCDCGKEKVIRSDRLLHPNGTKSCRCLSVELAIARRFKHGYSHKTEHNIWLSMKSRCYNEKHLHYSNYGGRGVTVCDRWLNSFENFLADMGPRPSPRHSLDRYPNNDGNYEPGNVRWATRLEQGCNKRNNRIFTFRGKTMILSDWARELGVDQAVIALRIDRLGWTIDKALSTPPRITKRTHWRKHAEVQHSCV